MTLASDRRPENQRLLASLERAFHSFAGPDARIDVADLQKALGLRSEYLAHRIHAAFDANGDGFVSREEFFTGVDRMLRGDSREKLRFAFRLHDHDGDGSLTREELLRMVTIGLAEDDVAFDQAAAERLVATLLTEGDENDDGRLTFEEFANLLDRHPRVLEQMTRGDARWILPNEDLIDRIEAPRASRLQHALANRRPAIAIVVAWVAINLALFALAWLHHGSRKTTPLDQLSKAATSCLLWNAALVLLPVLRRTLTWLRRTRVALFVPIDDAIDFHRLVGDSIALFAALHAFAILDGYVAKSQDFGSFLHEITNTRGITGVVLVLVIATMWIFARRFVRKSNRFELFYFTHLLYVPLIALAFVHAPAFVGWMGFGVALLVFEHVSRRVRRGRAASIVRAEPLRSGVTRLELARPAGFAHRAGDYLFLRIPQIARHEWHPFTISSAPESSALTVHARSLGNWTAALRKKFETQIGTNVEAFVDGPYGAPSGRIFESKVAVLIGAGIGVTPFASILESIALRSTGAGDPLPASLQKVHFFWINRDRYSFEWFAAMLADLERVDQKKMIDVHAFMTGGRESATAALLEVARELTVREGAIDLVTRLHARTRVGHPSWDEELGAIVQAHAAKDVDVFFCGPDGLARKVHASCASLGLRFTQEKF